MDAYSTHILNKIPDEILETFTFEQKEAVYKAIRKEIKPKKHTVDIRGVIPLFYRKYYFVVYSGRDTRSFTQKSEDERRKATRRFANLTFIFFLLSPLLLLVFLALYFVKSALGINIFANLHLSDISDFIFLKLEHWIDSFGK